MHYSQGMGSTRQFHLRIRHNQKKIPRPYFLREEYHVHPKESADAVYSTSGDFYPAADYFRNMVLYQKKTRRGV